jgi:hypothetical protein
MSSPSYIKNAKYNALETHLADSAAEIEKEGSAGDIST